jgi:hypothetical protein
VITVHANAALKRGSRAFTIGRIALHRGTDELAKQTAIEALNELRASVIYGRLQLAALSSSWLRRKGPGLPILVYTYAYMNSLTVSRTGQKGGWSVHPSARYRRVATWLEFGTSRMPGRPHWRPTQDLMAQRVKPAALAFMRDVVAQIARHAGGGFKGGVARFAIRFGNYFEKKARKVESFVVRYVRKKAKRIDRKLTRHYTGWSLKSRGTSKPRRSR